MERDIEDEGYFTIAEYLSWNSTIKSAMVPATPALYMWVRPMRLTDDHALERWLGARLRVDSATVGPYATVELTSMLPKLGPRKIQIFDHLPADQRAWVTSVVQRLQRPLYIGITLNLAERLDAHLRDGSRLREYLWSVSIDIMNCGVQYFLPPGESPDFLADDEEYGLGSSSEIDVPRRLRNSLQLAEALAIRAAQPYLNKSME